jgi:hypothetical protein
VPNLRFPRLKSHPDGCSHDATPGQPIFLSPCGGADRAGFSKTGPELREGDSPSLTSGNPRTCSETRPFAPLPSMRGSGRERARATDRTVWIKGTAATPSVRYRAFDAVKTAPVARGFTLASGAEGM